MLAVIKEILYWTWCLPQTILGLILKIIFKGKKVTIWNPEGDFFIDHYKCKLKSGSVSLGKYILICPGHYEDLETIKHEYGHQLQSFILGPLYLLVIGLPSLLWAISWDGKKDYYSFFTEKWANFCGKVKK